MYCLKPTALIASVFDTKNTVSVSRVSNMLAYTLKSGDDTVIFGGQNVKIHELGAHPDLQDLPADTIMIRFCGGPPGAYNTYSGSLLTYLIDRVVWEEVHGATGALRQLWSLLGITTNITKADHWMPIDEQITHTS